jgi:hypothetical protein
MQVAYESKESVVGMTPYLHHYVSSTLRIPDLGR